MKFEDKDLQECSQILELINKANYDLDVKGVFSFASSYRWLFDLKGKIEAELTKEKRKKSKKKTENKVDDANI